MYTERTQSGLCFTRLGSLMVRCGQARALSDFFVDACFFLFVPTCAGAAAASSAGSGSSSASWSASGSAFFVVVVVVAGGPASVFRRLSKTMRTSARCDSSRPSKPGMLSIEPCAGHGVLADPLRHAAELAPKERVVRRARRRCGAEAEATGMMGKALGWGRRAREGCACQYWLRLPFSIFSLQAPRQEARPEGSIWRRYDIAFSER